MALGKLRRPENVAGDFFVDSTCIDCDLCRQIAPTVFARSGDQSAVCRQPANPETEFAALKALVTCPTASIGDFGKHAAKRAVDAFPEPIDQNVFFCGFASESSYGASSYLIVRPEGNVLVDSPRFARPLVNRIAALGGVKLMFLTHRDDVADHDSWAREFDSERILHRDDTGGIPGIERVLTGKRAIRLSPDLTAIPTPGHTRGHMVLIYRDRYLFSGDHLRWSETFHTLHASRDVCWYSWDEQIRSVELLLDYTFEWVLPGHGRRAKADPSEMRRHLLHCLGRMQSCQASLSS